MSRPAETRGRTAGTRGLSALVALFCLAHAGRGGAVESGVATLKLDQALQMAMRRNRNLTVERTRLTQAQVAVDQAWAALFPTVAAQGRYTHNYKEVALGFGGAPLLIQPSEQFDGTINFVAPLLVPSAYPAVDAVKANVRAAEANYQVSEATVLAGVAQLFYLSAIADEVVIARQSGVQMAGATLTNAQTRFAAGTVTKVDVDRAELAVVRALQAGREAEFAREKSYRSLGTMIQLNGPFKVEIEAVPPENHDERELESALRLRPEFRTLEATRASAEAQRRAYALRWAPIVSAFGNARRFNYDNFAHDRHSWAFGAQLDWTLWDGGTRDAQRRISEVQMSEATARADAFRDSVRDDLTDGRRQLDTKRLGLEAALQSVALAREALELVRVQYEAGSVTQMELLQAQDAVVGSQEALAHARYDVAAADLLLRRAAGTFPPRP